MIWMHRARQRLIESRSAVPPALLSRHLRRCLEPIAPELLEGEDPVIARSIVDKTLERMALARDVRVVEVPAGGRVLGTYRTQSRFGDVARVRIDRLELAEARSDTPAFLHLGIGLCEHVLAAFGYLCDSYARIRAGLDEQDLVFGPGSPARTGANPEPSFRMMVEPIARPGAGDPLDRVQACMRVQERDRLPSIVLDVLERRFEADSVDGADDVQRWTLARVSWFDAAERLALVEDLRYANAAWIDAFGETAWVDLALEAFLDREASRLQREVALEPPSDA